MRVRAVIICNLHLGWRMALWVCSAQRTSISGALEVRTHPFCQSPLHLLTISLLQSPGERSGRVCGKDYAVCVFALLQKLPPILRWRCWGSDRDGDSGRRGRSHVNEDIVWLPLIKMFPQGCSIRGTNKKNVIAHVIKRCMMIHDNNCAGGWWWGVLVTVHDLINSQDTGKSIPDFIMDKSGQLSPDAHWTLMTQLICLFWDSHFYLTSPKKFKKKPAEPFTC